MRFIIPVNEVEYDESGMGSQTLKIVDVGDVSPRTAKRKLRMVLQEWGIPNNRIKKLIKEYFNVSNNGNPKG
jgi:hypothetical protein